MDLPAAECFRDLRSSSKRVACQGDYQEARGQWPLAGSRVRLRGSRPALAHAHVPASTTARLCSRAPKGARASDSTDVPFCSCVQGSTDQALAIEAVTDDLENALDLDGDANRDEVVAHHLRRLMAKLEVP